MDASSAMPPAPDFVSCPFLPPQDSPLSAACLKPLGKLDRGPEFYRMALEYAQSLWQRGLPAQALLQINWALGADVPAGQPVLLAWPLPYAAAAWILEHHQPGHFIGNPRRHYQHLATRMVEPRRELRAWRAWACWWITRCVRPELPADEVQLRQQGIAEPTESTIYQALQRWGHPEECEQWSAVSRRYLE